MSKFDQILNEEESNDQNFLIVTHGGTIMEFINVLNKIKDPNSEDVFKINSKNTCLNVFKMTKDQSNGKVDVDFNLVNCDKHLE